MKIGLITSRTYTKPAEISQLLKIWTLQGEMYQTNNMQKLGKLETMQTADNHQSV